MKMLKRLAVGLGLMALTASAVAGYTPGAGITGTPHDWSATNGTSLLLWDTGKKDPVTGATITSTDSRYGTVWIDPATGVQGKTKVTIGQCTKCHTPHQAKSTNLLWNHTLQSTQYKWDDPATTAGTQYATFKGDTYKGATTKCLSCHDGLMASTDGMWFNRQSVSGSKYVPAPGSLDSGHEVANGASMNKTHPVAMPYPLNGLSSLYNFVTNGNAIEPTEWVKDPMATNKIRLFNDDGTGNITAGTVASKTGIECSSCHDVHNGARTKDQLLLTGMMSGSDRSPGGYICTQCHLK